jgi:hypothetical protein
MSGKQAARERFWILEQRQTPPLMVYLASLTTMFFRRFQPNCLPCAACPIKINGVEV